MTDKVFQKQMKKFGNEETLLVASDSKIKRKIDFSAENSNIVKAIMDTMEGRQWMWSKLDMCGVFTAPWAGEKPLTNAYFSGVQAVGQDLLGDVMAAAPNEFFLMIQEAAARKKS